MSLDALQIKTSPKSFEHIAAAHNALVALLASMEGVNGIKVTATEGRILIEFTGTVGSGGGGGTEGAAISIIGYDGRLNLVPKHSTWTSPTAFPSYLQTGVFTGDNVAISTYAITIQNGFADNYSVLDKNGFKTINYTNGAEVHASCVNGIKVFYGGKNLVIAPSLITHDMQIRDIDVCDSGTPKKMLVIGSAPY